MKHFQFYIFPLALLLAACSSKPSGPYQPPLEERPLQEDQRCDGKMLFNIPEGYTCETICVKDSIAGYVISQGSDATVTLQSDFARDYTRGRFDQLWTSQMPQDVAWREDSATPAQLQAFGMNKGWMRTITSEDGTQEWTFILLFNERQHKTATLQLQRTVATPSVAGEIASTVRLE